MPRVRRARSRGWPCLDDDALVHEHHAVGDLAGEAHLVGDDDHRHAVVGEPAHHVEHLADELRVERRGRLVEEHQLRLHGERARDRDPLLLAARELRRVAVEPCRRGRRARAARAPRSRGVAFAIALHADRRLDDVLERRHVREEVEALEDHADLGALARDLAIAQLVQLVAALRGSRRARRRPTAGRRRSSRDG